MPINCSAFAKVALEAGEVVIRALEGADIGGAAVLLTRCFGHIDGRNITEIRSRCSHLSVAAVLQPVLHCIATTKSKLAALTCRQYVTEMLECPPDGVFLVACLIPTGTPQPSCQIPVLLIRS